MTKPAKAFQSPEKNVSVCEPSRLSTSGGSPPECGGFFTFNNQMQAVELNGFTFGYPAAPASVAEPLRLAVRELSARLEGLNIVGGRRRSGTLKLPGYGFGEVSDPLW